MRHSRSEHGGFGVNLGLIITPMLDMSFQILAFFIMTYHPSGLEAQISGALAPPLPAGPGEKLPDFVPPPPGDVVLEDAVTVIIKVGDKTSGKPQKLLLKQTTEPAPRQIAGAEKTWEQAQRDLGRELQRLRPEGAADNPTRLAADGERLQQYVMDVYAVCKRAGYTKIHFVPPPAGR